MQPQKPCTIKGINISNIHENKLLDITKSKCFVSNCSPATKGEGNKIMDMLPEKKISYNFNYNYNNATMPDSGIMLFYPIDS